MDCFLAFKYNTDKKNNIGYFFYSPVKRAFDVPDRSGISLAVEL